MHREEQCPLELGPHLGDLTDEYPKHDILEYSCGGAVRILGMAFTTNFFPIFRSNTV